MLLYSRINLKFLKRINGFHTVKGLDNISILSFCVAQIKEYTKYPEKIVKLNQV
jgi:hypothetical protein